MLEVFLGVYGACGGHNSVMHVEIINSDEQLVYLRLG